MLEIELVIVYYVIACARDYIQSLIVIALDTIIPGSRVIHKRRHSSRHPRRPRAIKYSSFPILYKRSGVARSVRNRKLIA